MNIRKKLTLASVLMILIPIVVSVLLCLILLFFGGSKTLNRIRSLYDTDNGLLNAQTILYNCREQVLGYEPVAELYEMETEQEDDWDDEGVTDNEKWDDYEKEDEEEWDDDDEDDDNEEDDDEEDDDADEEKRDHRKNTVKKLWTKEKQRQKKAFGTLEKELTSIGYFYEIAYDSQRVASTLPYGASDKIAALAGAGYEALPSFSVTNGKISVVKRTYEKGDNTISVLAYCEQYVGSPLYSQVIREILFLLGMFSVILLITIIISIFVLTRWLSGGMRQSLDALSEGVRQVQDGNLSYRIGSAKKDELGKACQEFDEMADYLEHSVRERERYEEARKQMLAGISHDLRTPLTSIKAYVEGLRDGIADTEEKKQRYYDALQIRTEDLETLIDNLSVFSRFDRGEYHYTMEEISLTQFLDEYFRENEIELLEKRVKIQRTYDEKKEYNIQGDKKQLRRILGNFLDNAVKYREKPNTLWEIALWETKNTICLEITDDGPGVPEEERDKIFDTFYRGDKARQNPGSGNGLGLSIVREIMKDHGGSIRAGAGAHGRGLRLLLTFPKITDRDAPEGKAKA